MKIKKIKHEFAYLPDSRNYTDLIVIHHVGDNIDRDTSAVQIHDIHIGMGYIGIGYHYVIRKNGLIETGRPCWGVGAHCYGENYHSIGICLSGDFNIGNPTGYQIEAAAELIAKLSKKYDFIPDYNHVKAHKDLNETDCPGRNIDMNILRGKAVWYRANY